MKSTIQNPILRGFNPDPSIIKVGDTFYIATSTFEWFPGVQIHKSKDLSNWTQCQSALSTLKHLDLKGVPDSCGVWAPCLSYHDGIFYLQYSNVKTFDGVYKDVYNYLTTTTDIEGGKWTDPIYLGNVGFDGSLFHDDDGKKWFTSLRVDHRNGKFFGGIILQEYNAVSEELIGKRHLIWEGSELGITEGPHIYKFNGYYYLLTAEGGTEYNHAVSIARSRSILGPYETHPNNPIVTCVHDEKHSLQKSGHASLVQANDGQWYMTFLTGRPLTPKGRCTLGRETSIAKVYWGGDDWLYLENDDKLPPLQFKSTLEEHKWKELSELIEFKELSIDSRLSSLRIPIDKSWCCIEEETNTLVLRGKDSLCSTHCQSLLARRIQDFSMEAETEISFFPNDFQQMAGLTFYYNTRHFYYLNVSYCEKRNTRVLQITSNVNLQFKDELQPSMPIPDLSSVFLRGKMDRNELQFYYSVDGQLWTEIGPVVDASILSDDFVREGSLDYRPAFTGAFTGICCQDQTGGGMEARFHYFNYKSFESNHIHDELNLKNEHLY